MSIIARVIRMMKKVFIKRHKEIICAFLGALISSMVSFTVLLIQTNSERKIIRYEKEIDEVNEIRDAAISLVVASYPSFLIDVANQLSDGMYQDARVLVYRKFDELNKAIVNFNVIVRTYKGTEDKFINEFSDKVNIYALIYTSILSLIQKMCLFIFSDYSFKNFGDSFNNLYGTSELENRILDTFKEKYDLHDPILPVRFAVFLSELHNVTDIDNSIDCELMMYVGNSLSAYKDILSEKLLD